MLRGFVVVLQRRGFVSGRIGRASAGYGGVTSGWVVEVVLEAALEGWEGAG